MADYYPLIARAVAGLEKNNGENRRALYERARTALLTQLRGVTPALEESDITRERLALEESIRKVEAEAARKFVESKRQPPPRIRPVEAPPRQETDASPSLPLPRRPIDARPPSAPSQPREQVARPSRPPGISRGPLSPTQPRSPPPAPPSDSIDAEASIPPLRMPLRRPPERRATLDPVRKEFRGPPPNADLDDASMAMEQPQSLREGMRSPVDLDRAARLPDRGEEPHREELDQRERDGGRFERGPPETLDTSFSQVPAFEAQRPPHPHNDFSEPMLESSYALDEAESVPSKSRRPARRGDEEDTELEHGERQPRAWLALPGAQFRRALAGGVLVFALIALFAWQWPNMVALYRTMRAPAVETARDAPPSTSRQKITDRIEPGAQLSPTPAPGTQAGAAVAQKVVLYEEDPVDPNGKRFVGSAIWRTETVTPGPGQSPELAVRADVEVPERKITMNWSLRRNLDKTLPASHTVEIIFKLPADFPSGGISNVPGILMKQAEQTRGVPLAGLAVKVTNGFFLIGLSSADGDKERNLQLLKERGWFDIPVVYNNNRRAILAMEKGTPGERAFAEAFKVWKQ
jgi:hypothetical protein